MHASVLQGCQNDTDHGLRAVPRMWEICGPKRLGANPKRRVEAIWKPARSIAARVSRARWQPPDSRGYKVASSARCTRAVPGRSETTCS